MCINVLQMGCKNGNRILWAITESKHGLKIIKKQILLDDKNALQGIIFLPSLKKCVIMQTLLNLKDTLKTISAVLSGQLIERMIMGSKLMDDAIKVWSGLEKLINETCKTMLFEHFLT
jgi:hypothetical protein